MAKAKQNVFHESKEPKGLPIIKGYDFNKGVNHNAIIDSFANTGFQSSQLSEAIKIINEMRKSKCKIILGYTSNMVTSGLRDIFRYLTEHKMVDIIVTTGGGVEEDIIKCLGNFYLGEFTADGKKLREQGINRAGNIFIPNQRYIDFEKFIQPILKDLLREQKESNKIASPSEIIWKLGKAIDSRESIYYWAQKNKIPVYCPAIVDGSIGDMVYFFNTNNNLLIDTAQDLRKFNDEIIFAKKTGIIILGGGLVKHHICNANMLRNGADYAVYINTHQEYDGSDAGARPDEAVSWGKILPDAKMVKVYGDATILFPLIVEQTFAKK